MSQYFPKLYEPFGGYISVKVELSNYATESDLQKAADVNTWKFPKKVDLASLKSNVDKLGIDKLKNMSTDLSNLKIKVDKLDIDKLATLPVDFSKLSNVVKSYVVKKDVYSAKINNIEDKIPVITNLATKNTLNAKINEVKW